MSQTLRANVLVVSDTASLDTSQDSCIPALRQLFARQPSSWQVEDTSIVPDDPQRIQRTVQGWTDGEHPPHLIVTTGGTGFGVRDITPEVGQIFRTSYHMLERSI